MSDQFQAMCDKLNVSYDNFQRTTDRAHHRASIAIWEAMKANGDLYLDRYEGWYSVRDEAFYEEKELIDGEGRTHLSPQGTPVEWTVEESWFFKLSNYEKRLLELYEKQPDFIRPDSRRNEVMRFVEGGLRDLSISRTSFDWGVKVPGSPDHVMYVWVDALTNYLTGLGYPDATGDMTKFWPASLHLIGKDIVRFHAVYWPAFLMSAGLPLPKQVFGHGFVLARSGEKMSKSLGNVVDPIALADRYGVDALRYFLLREVTFGSDGSYSEEAIVTRVNADLANGLGNLAQRCLSMIAKNCDGVLPVDLADTRPPHLGDVLGHVAELMEQLKLNEALEEIWGAVSVVNGYFAEMAPWALRKTEPEVADGVLYHTAEAVRQLAILARWAIPAGADRLLNLLAQPNEEEARNFSALSHPLVGGIGLPSPVGIFPRLELPVEADA
jgi:methionyl-tRNA synthetase